MIPKQELPTTFRSSVDEMRVMEPITQCNLLVKLKHVVDISLKNYSSELSKAHTMNAMRVRIYVDTLGPRLMNTDLANPSF